MQEPFAEHRFSNHIFCSVKCGEKSLKKNGYFPLSDQGPPPLETSEQSLLQVKPSFELAPTFQKQPPSTCCWLTATSLVTVIQNRIHCDWREATGNAKDSALPTGATHELDQDHLLTAANAATLTCTPGLNAKSKVAR